MVPSGDGVIDADLQGGVNEPRHFVLRATHAKKALTVSLVRGLVLRCLLIGVAYYYGSLLGHALIFPGSYISIVWPPNTVLLVALLLSRRWQWPWLLLMMFPVHQLAQAGFEVPAATAALYYVFDCVLVLLTVASLRRVGLGDLALASIRHAVLFMLVILTAVAVTSLVWSPLIVSVFLGGDRWAAWGLVFLSNLLPFLIATPAFVIGLRRRAEVLRTTSLASSMEFLLLTAGLALCPFVIPTLAPPVLGTLPVLFYMPVPFLTWAAIRYGPGGLSFAFLIFAARAIFDTTAGVGPFVGVSADESVLRLQIFMLALYAPFLMLASVVQERRAKAAALSASEARYRAVVEDQTELICRFLTDGTYTFVNDAYCQYFQLSREELLGQSFWRFLPPEGHQAAREFLASITPRQAVATIEHEVIAPGGEIRWQQWRDRGFFDEHGRIVEYQAVGHDITERKTLEEGTRRLAHGSRLAAVGELTAAISHEINQPLQAILHNVVAAERALAADTSALSELREILDDIRRDDLRASEVIQRVRLLLSRHEPQMVDLDLNEVVHEVVRLVGPDAGRRRITLDTTFGDGLPGIRGDRVHLQQVLLNLLLNGMDAMHDTPEPDRLLVVCTEAESQQSVRVAISDAGHGIPTDKLPRIFESFFTTKADGLGLGLAIARSIISAHGGHLRATNNAGAGATFSFTLPAKRAR